MRLLKYLLMAALISAPLPIVDAQSAGWLPLVSASGGGGGGSPTWTNTTSANNTACGFVTTCAIAGVVVPTGFVVFAVAVDNGSASSGTITGVAFTAGGCTGTLTQAQANTIPSGSEGVALFYGTVTGGTCTVSVTFSLAGAIAHAGVGLGLLSNLSSTTPGTGCQAQYSAFSAAPYVCGSSITVPAGGYGICAFAYNSVTTMTSPNLVIDGQQNNSSLSNGIGNTRVTETPSFGGTNVVHAGIACAPWS